MNINVNNNSIDNNLNNNSNLINIDNSSCINSTNIECKDTSKMSLHNEIENPSNDMSLQEHSNNITEGNLNNIIDSINTIITDISPLDNETIEHNITIKIMELADNLLEKKK